MDRTLRAITAVTLALILLSAGFIGGVVAARALPIGVGLFGSEANLIVQAEGSDDGVGSKIDEVNRLLQSDALEPPSETSATVGAINGLLESNGDKYALYFDAKHFKYFNEQTEGAFGGIGVVLGEKDGGAYVVEVYDNTPAAKGGVKTGDIIHTIDGTTREKWTVDEVVKRVRGEEGTTVTVAVKRAGAEKPVSVTMTRAKIEIPNVESEVIDGVGYIRMGSFNARSAEDVRKALTDLPKKGAKSIVFDLRDNPGGLLDAAVDVSSLWIADGVIVRVDERSRPEVEHRAAGGVATKLPLVVLINGNSASASEIFAGAIKDHGRGTLVGEKSFGKGSVQTLRELAAGGAIKFTTAHYLTPKKRVINGKGLEPDVKVVMDAEKQAEQATDTQLQKALELARSKAK